MNRYLWCMKSWLLILLPLLFLSAACQETANSQSTSEPSLATPAVQTSRAMPELDVHCTAANAELCQSHLEGIKAADLSQRALNDIVITVGKRFLGTPYVAKTLDIEGEEKLVVNLQGLDCTTFLENTVVMSRLVQQNRLDIESFHQELAHIRYRDSEPDGYPSRLHYFTEWIHTSGQKGIIRDITEEIGGVPFDKSIDFMSTHRDAYAQLVNDEYYAAIQQMEATLNATYPRSYIPTAKIQEVEHLIQDGDLLALTTSIKGLDVAHVGLALHQNGRLHLFHASTGSNEVEISKKPLAEYQEGIKSQTGVMVLRLQDAKGG